MSVNKIVLIGNLGKQPEVKELTNGKVATFSLATTEKGYTMQNGTVKPDVTYWHSIVVWGKLSEVVEKYCTKGSQIYVEGKLTYRQYEKDGIKHTVSEIVCERLELLGSKPKSEDEPVGRTEPSKGEAWHKKQVEAKGDGYASSPGESDGLPF